MTKHGDREIGAKDGGARCVALGLIALAAAAAGSACGAPVESGSGGSSCGPVFVAANATFQGFRTWEAFPLDSVMIAASPHTSGPRTVYLKQRPPHGSKAFPSGTVIVKEFEQGDFATRQVFAMVKRCGDFNAEGATDWEWFQLVNSADGSMETILWSGTAPPLGDSYAGNPEACNECHGIAKSNDFVQAPQLALSNF